MISTEDVKKQNGKALEYIYLDFKRNFRNERELALHYGVTVTLAKDAIDIGRQHNLRKYL